jgi:hypothetical protein
MTSILSSNESHLARCLLLEDDEIFQYIVSENLTLFQTEKLLNQLCLSDHPNSPINSVSIKSNKPLPRFKKQHSGVFEHYLGTLRANPHFDGRAVQSIKQSVLETRLRMKFRTPLHRTNAYGLVLGRIQSGKTAHLIGTVLHSIDSDVTDVPYDTVIILSGLIDDLRIQTRDRLAKVLDAFGGSKIEILPSRDEDLNANNADSITRLQKHLLPHQHSSSILVVKKNHKILENILDLLSQKAVHGRKKFLIIDDEADHASMDTNASTYEVEEDIIDENPSLTNQLLRQIIQILSKSSRCWYIGYTATPYANLLMSATEEDEQSDYGLPLFPRDFLHGLPKPKGHLDNEYYFSTPPGHTHVELRQSPEVDSEEEEHLISELFHRHLLTQIIKNLRELNIHHTTLVHTDISVSEHHRFVESFRAQLQEIKEDKSAKKTIGILKQLLSDYTFEPAERIMILRELDRMSVNWELVAKEIRKIKIVEVNRRPQSIEDKPSQDLEYGRGFSKKSYIAVGGTRLSRGLTLEGLTTTWFTRAAQTPVYDTMLQMARWCGYRGKYDDLIKIYTTSDIRDYYRHITMVEQEIRYQVGVLAADANPMDTLIWIKEHSNMNVTAKMPAEYHRSDWGEVSHPHFWSYETPYFGSSAIQASKQIYHSFERLVSQVGGANAINSPPLNALNSFKIANSVRNRKIKSFLQSYLDSFAGNLNSKSAVRLNQILSQWNTDYQWNLAVHTPSGSLIRSRVSVRRLEIGLVQRATELENPERFSIIQSSNEDVFVDTHPGDHRETPLLLIYLINPDSKRGKHRNERVFHRAIDVPAVGLGIILPNELVGDGGTKITRKKEVIE